MKDGWKYQLKPGGLFLHEDESFYFITSINGGDAFNDAFGYYCMAGGKRVYTACYYVKRMATEREREHWLRENAHRMVLL